jgi:uncharacterized protein
MDDPFCKRLVHAISSRSLADGSKIIGLRLFGGEPLLNMTACLALLEGVKTFCDKNRLVFRGGLTSNGVLLTQNTIKLLAAFVSSVHLTLDGPREVHDKVRTDGVGKATFDRILDAAKMLREEGIAVHIRLQLDSRYIDAAPRLGDQLREAGIESGNDISFSVVGLDNYNGCRSCGQHIEPGSSERILAKLPGTAAAGPPPTQIVPCIVFDNTLCVDPNGDLFQCITDIGRPSYRVGFLSAGGGFQFTRERQRWLRRDPLMFSDCGSCPALPLCGGGCPIKARQSCGSFQQSACSDRREAIDHRIREFIRTYEKKQTPTVPV